MILLSMRFFHMADEKGYERTPFACSHLSFKAHPLSLAPFLGKEKSVQKKPNCDGLHFKEAGECVSFLL
jgi:hypothetical protein